jgi:ferredoxin
MTQILDALLYGSGAALFVWLGFSSFVSWREGEPRAAGRLLLLTLLVPLPYLAVVLLPGSAGATTGTVMLALTLAAAAVVLVPTGARHRAERDTPTTRFDERDVMFSRVRLVPGSKRFTEYYEANPENFEPDEKFRAEAGLLRKGSTLYEPLSFAAADASFRTVEELRSLVDGKVAAEQEPVDAEVMTRFLKGWALKLGAVSVGITELRDYHKYTVIGRGEQYGQPVELDHARAIAVTVEMSKEMIDRAPRGPTVMESAQQYLESGAIAVQLALFIRSLGYPARAHIDGNYRVVALLVARDAGLGEIGRMGLLMTPGLGPRVRLGVVTTDLPLVPDRRSDELSVLDFCRICKKCADNCPVRAIPHGNREEIDGVLRWRINQDICYRYWCTTGTDCARCVAVCPYSHADNAMHNVVRWAVRQSGLARRAMLWLDDVFYGAAPEPKPAPVWVRSGSAGSVRRIDMKSSEE